MSESARYNAEAQIMEVRFDSGHKYQYCGVDPETWHDFMAGRWAENGTATYYFLMGWSGVRVS